MKNKKFSVILLSAIVGLIFLVPGITSVSAAATTQSATAGAVFTQTNSATGNWIMAFSRASDGVLTYAGEYSTHGLGTGAGLGDQGSLAMSGGWLFAVNAGSNQLTAFRVLSQDKLQFADIVSYRGVSPISVTVHDDLVYVVNAGNSTTAGNIVGFRVSSSGMLYPIPGSVRSLSSPGAVGPAEISFNPWGTVLAVTEKNTNNIDTYILNKYGVAGPATVTASNGTEPFGFAFDPNGQLVVSNAASGSLSSYSVSTSGALTVISGSIVDGGIAPCWVAITGNGQYAYTANAHGNTLSSYSINHSGKLALQQSVAANTNLTPLDLAFGGNSRFLYSFNSGSNEITVFSVAQNGGLIFLQTIGGLASSGAGLVAV
jgi:6-phosphogluconolactonase